MFYYLRQKASVPVGVCLFICEQNNSKSWERILLKFWGSVNDRHGTDDYIFSDNPDSGDSVNIGLSKIMGQDHRRKADNKKTKTTCFVM